MTLSPLNFNLLTVWLPALVGVAIITLLRRKLASRLRWTSMLLRVTASHIGDDASMVVSAKERQVLTTLLQNITLLAALGASLSMSLLIAPTEIIYEAGDGDQTLVQCFICLSFLSVGAYLIVVVESALSLLYLEQYSDAQLHAILCEKAAELFVEPLLGFISATVYLLAAGILFCGYLYGVAAVIGLSVVVTIPIVKVGRSWAYLERFDSHSFALARKMEAGQRLSCDADAPGGLEAHIKRQITIVGQSKLLDAMKEQRKKNSPSKFVRRVRHISATRKASAAMGAGVVGSPRIAPRLAPKKVAEDLHSAAPDVQVESIAE